MSPETLAAVYRRAAALCEEPGRAWTACLVMAADEHGVDEKDVARETVDEVARFLWAAPNEPMTHERAMAMFRFVADAVEERKRTRPRR
jgi:hypothetical protein